MKEFILLGNPNTGKTTLYNALTHSFEHASNFHGVTVCEKKKQIINSSLLLSDLPGLYSLSPLSPEEKIAADRAERSENIVIVLDANSLFRNLYLAVEFLERGKSVIFALNFKHENDNYNLNHISDVLKSKIIAVDAYNKLSLKTLVLEMQNFKADCVSLSYINDYYISNVIEIIEHNAKKCNLSAFYCATRVICHDKNLTNKLQLSDAQLSQLEKLLSGICGEEYICSVRYKFIQTLLKSSEKSVKNKSRYYITQKIDNFMLKPFFALTTFMIFMLGIFAIAFGHIGNYLSDILSKVVYIILGDGVIGLLSRIIDVPWILALFYNALLGGVMAVLSFLPQVVMLSCGIKVLEDTGVLSRIALILDPYFKRIGLSGRSVFSLLIGFGCNTTAIMVTRNIENEKIRKRTMFILPFISCSACIPIILLITSAFFFKGRVLILFALYLFSLLIALFILVILSKVSKIKDEGFLLELPLYRLPKFKKVIVSFFSEAKKYVSRTLTTILGFSVILFILSSFTFTLKLDPANSILSHFTKFLSVVFIPLGLGNPEIVVALIIGVLAKEMIVSSLAMSNGITSGDISKSLGISLVSASSAVFFTPITAIVFMLFVILYSPCIATLKMIRREGSWPLMFACLLCHLVISYLVCFALYRLLLLLSSANYLTAFLCIIILALSIAFVLKYSKKQSCSNCSSANCSDKCNNFHNNVK